MQIVQFFLFYVNSIKQPFVKMLELFYIIVLFKS